MSLRNSREEEEESSDSDKQDQHQPAQQTFVDSGGYPLCFFIHESVTKPDARLKLTGDIKSHGGSVVSTDTNADIVIFDDAKVDRDVQQLFYDVHPNKSMQHIYVEPMSFIQRCIREGKVRHRLKERQGMGGVVGRTRAPFTEDEDLNLCRYLALRIPVKKAGGRSGDVIYKQLESLAAQQPTQYSWVRRHTWQSLRQRYKKKSVYFDKIIDNFVKNEQPTAKQHYFRNRAWRGGRPKSHQDASDDDDEHRERDEDGNEEVFDPESEWESEVGNEEDPGRDETEMNNMAVIQGKRRRSENRRGSLPFASPAKRQRIERQSQRTPIHHPRISQIQVNGKEKQSAQPQSHGENGDQPHQKSSLFSEDEDDAAGPSGMQHTPFPSPLLVSRRSRSPFLTQPQTSQATLIATSALHDRQHMPSSGPDQVDVSLRAKPSGPGNEQPGASPKVHISQPRVRRTRKPLEPNIQTLPLVDEQPTGGPLVSVGTLPSRSSRAVKKKATPLGSTFTVPFAAPDPPYRNTRSRSRSVEPSNAPTQRALTESARRRKVKETALPHLQPLEETIEEEDIEVSDMRGVGDVVLTAQSGEAMEEERDVEELLVANVTDISSVSQYPEGLDPQMGNTSQESINNRDLSTDDEQAERTLRRVHKLPRPQFPTSNINLDDRPEDILKRLDARSTSSRRSSARPPFLVRSNLARISAEGPASSSRTGRSVADLNPQPSTPVRSRKRSTSSTESFPLIGTRASVMKRKIQEEEKNNPYTPPPGTRAAKHRK